MGLTIILGVLNLPKASGLCRLKRKGDSKGSFSVGIKPQRALFLWCNEIAQNEYFVQFGEVVKKEERSCVGLYMLHIEIICYIIIYNTGNKQ